MQVGEGITKTGLLRASGGSRTSVFSDLGHIHACEFGKLLLGHWLLQLGECLEKNNLGFSEALLDRGTPTLLLRERLLLARRSPTEHFLLLLFFAFERHFLQVIVHETPPFLAVTAD